MSQVATIQPNEPSSTTGRVVQADATSLMEVISRAAADPATDVIKLEKLMGLYERINAQKAKAAFMEALSEMQPKLPAVIERGGIRDRGGNIQSRYALWEDINEAIRPAMAAHGFAISFRIGRSADQVSVTGVLSHRDGHSEDTTMALPVDGSGSKNAVQAVASSTSYGKRYTAMALLNITTRGEDDDGQSATNSAPPPATITEQQAMELREMLESTGADQAAFLKHAKVPRIDTIPAKDFGSLMALLRRKGERR